MGVSFGRFAGEGLVWDLWWVVFCYLFEKYDLNNLWISNLAFLDDIQIVATCLVDAQAMLDDVSLVMTSLGLRLKTSKLRWLANRWAETRPEDCLWHNESRVFESESIKILGSVFVGSLNERPTVDHRCGAA